MPSLRARASLLLLASSLLLPACARDAAKSADAAPEPALSAQTSDTPTRKPEAAEEDPAQPEGRMVIRTASVELRSESPSQVVARAIELAEQVGGFVAGSNSHGVGEDVDQASATLRVPSTAFESVLHSLRQEGELLNERLGGQDVTDQYVDVTARLRSQRALEDRLLAILVEVKAVEDALRIETELTRVRTEIERLDAERRSMEDRVSFATVELVVSSPVRHNAVQAETVASRLDRAIDDGGSAFVAVIAGLIRFLGAVLPLGVVIGPLAYALHRGMRRRKAALALALRTPGHPPQHPPYA